MKIIIGHLFYDLLNLYGESGNIIALKKALESQDIEVEIKNFSLDNEPWNLEEVDVLYVGAGTEENIELSLSTLLKYKDELNQHILNNKFILATGNSIELFGKSINVNSTLIDSLGILDYTCIRTQKRLVSECIFSLESIDEKILGFENHQSTIDKIEDPLFVVEKGFGYNNEAQTEGIRKKNFKATYLLGPLLVRNPELLEKICKEIISTKNSNFEFKEFNFMLEKQAHNKFLG